MRAFATQPGSIGIKNENAVIIERDFSGLPFGFVAVVRVLPVEAGFIAIGGDPLFDGLPGWLDGLDLFENYDPALLRRIQRHIHSHFPNASMRRELFSLHLSNPDRVTADYAILAALSRGLSGGDILNVCVNAIYAGSTDADPERWVVTQKMMESEIAKARKAKAEHSGERQGPKRRIGFLA